MFANLAFVVFGALRVIYPYLTHGPSHPYHLDEAIFILGGYRSNFSFLAHLSRRLIGEHIVYEGIRRPSVVCHHFQTTSPLKP